MEISKLLKTLNSYLKDESFTRILSFCLSEVQIRNLKNMVYLISSNCNQIISPNRFISISEQLLSSIQFDLQTILFYVKKFEILLIFLRKDQLYSLAKTLFLELSEASTSLGSIHELQILLEKFKAFKDFSFCRILDNKQFSNLPILEQYENYSKILESKICDSITIFEFKECFHSTIEKIKNITCIPPVFEFTKLPYYANHSS